MKPIAVNSKLPHTGTTIFTVMNSLAKEYSAINLSQGFPDFEVAPELIDLIDQAMRDGHNQYAPMPGILSLREVISAKTQSLHQHFYNPQSEITITAGATQAIFTAISAFVGPGDEVVIFTPAYDCYVPAINLMGGTVVPIPLTQPEFSIPWEDLECKCTSKTRMLIINTPHNPSGTILSHEDMAQLDAFMEQRNILVLSDEVYEHIVFDGKKHHSACEYPNLAAKSLICSSFGKTFHATGWKMGYCTAPEYLMTEFRKVHQYNVFCCNHPIQWALAQYLLNPENYLGVAPFYESKRNRFLEGLSESPFAFTPAEGTYFQVLDYSGWSDEPDIILAQRLVKEYGLASIPLSVFNPNGEDHKQLRFCFAKSEVILDKATRILNRL